VPPSTFFAVADIGAAQEVAAARSDGDLWPSTWADDGELYAACGDGLGFDLAGPWRDIVVNRISGTPSTGLSGERLASGREVAPVWTDPARYNSKPTGMVAVDGDGDGRDELYLAVQDLCCVPGPGIFNDAPAAAIVRSTDYGRTWSAPSAPQFTDHRFTTIMFVDLGRSNRFASRIGDPHMVYAVGLDHNWRTPYDAGVPDPVHLYLGRVPSNAVTDGDAWQFYAGKGPDGPRWGDLDERIPVLTDDTKHHPRQFPVSGGSGTISQGGIVYIPAYDRFVYSSWSEFTLELYEAPRPWGPWRHVVCRDFGPYPWVGPCGDHPRHGGYGTTIPSKFLSDDGRTAWLQSNWFVQASTYGGRTYGFSLRRLRLEPPRPAPASLPPAGTNLARLDGVAAFSSGARAAHLDVLNDGMIDRAEDSWSGEVRDLDYWGYQWPCPLTLGRVRYTAGPYDQAGGWFAEVPRVEFRAGGVWHDSGASVSPAYVSGPVAGRTPTYEFTFPPVVADGVRLVGRPGGDEAYTAVSELEVFSS
jgi:hypothetical protein